MPCRELVFLSQAAAQSLYDSAMNDHDDRDVIWGLHAPILTDVDFPKALRPQSEPILCIWHDRPAFGGEYVTSLRRLNCAGRESEQFLLRGDRLNRLRHFIEYTLDFFSRYQGACVGEEVVIATTSATIPGGRCRIGGGAESVEVDRAEASEEAIAREEAVA